MSHPDDIFIWPHGYIQLRSDYEESSCGLSDDYFVVGVDSKYYDQVNDYTLDYDTVIRLPTKTPEEELLDEIGKLLEPIEYKGSYADAIRGIIAELNSYKNREPIAWFYNDENDCLQLTDNKYVTHYDKCHIVTELIRK
jgi:hypothetical protein